MEAVKRADAELCPHNTTANAEADREIPSISNIVSTQHLLSDAPDAPAMPRAGVQRLFGHSSLYAPKRFAACTIGTTDRHSQQTVLLFGSGSVVLVGSRTAHHALLRAKMVALAARRAQYACPDGRPGKRLLSALRFERGAIHNWVGYCQLPWPVDLKAMCRAFPLTCTHDKTFPGLTCRTWLTRSYACECRTNRRRRAAAAAADAVVASSTTPKCKCSLGVLIFQTGHVVIPGCATRNEVNRIYWRVRCATNRMRQTVTGEEGGPPPQ